MLNNWIPLFVLDFFLTSLKKGALIEQTEVLTEKNLRCFCKCFPVYFRSECLLKKTARSVPDKTLVLAPPSPRFPLFSECAENSACHQQFLESFEEHKLSHCKKGV